VPPPPIVSVTNPLEVANLAAEILRPERERPVVCVTSPTWARAPLLDVEALRAALGDAATVYVLPTGELSWELTDRLPPRHDVYGGATRVWWPGAGATAAADEHPVFTIRDTGESSLVVDRIVRAFERRGFLSTTRAAAGDDIDAVVTAVREHGAQLTLADGSLAYAPREALTSAGRPRPRGRRRRPGSGEGVPIALRAGPVAAHRRGARGRYDR
jgi:hypothetical protein